MFSEIIIRKRTNGYSNNDAQLCIKDMYNYT